MIQRPTRCAAALTILAAALLTSGPDTALAQTMTAKLDGQDWVASNVTATSIWQRDNALLSLNAVRDSGGRVELLSLHLYRPADNKYEQTYRLTDSPWGPNGTFTHDTRTSEANENVHEFKNGEVTIESYDAATDTVSGTFSGIARNHAGTRTVTFSEGRFANIKLRKLQ